jgi:hypothetical protein
LKKERIEITFPMVKEAYIIHKRIKNNEITIEEAKNIIHEKTGLDPGSAGNYFNNIRCLKIGQVYNMKMKPEDTLYILSQILKDDGTTILNLALSALDQHINYVSYILGEYSSVEKLYNNIKNNEIDINEVVLFYKNNNLYYPYNYRTSRTDNFTTRNQNVFDINLVYEYLDKNSFLKIKEEVLSIESNNLKRQNALRRGYIIIYLKKENLLNNFFDKYWKNAYTTGKSYINYILENEDLVINTIKKRKNKLTKPKEVNIQNKNTSVLISCIQEDNFTIINKAFRKILPILAEFIGRILKNKNYENWWKIFIIDKLPKTTTENLPHEKPYDEYYNKLDIQACLNIIEYNWLDIFKYEFNKEGKYRTWARELKDVRNDFDAHYTTQTLDSFSDDDLKRAIDTMARFMIPINKKISEEIKTIINLKH